MQNKSNAESSFEKFLHYFRSALTLSDIYVLKRKTALFVNGSSIHVWLFIVILLFFGLLMRSLSNNEDFSF